MAFVSSDPNQETDENKKNQPPTLSSASSVINVDAVQPNPTTPTSDSQKSSGRFTNLQSYLSANKDQSQALGASVGQKITGQGDTARNLTNQSQQVFNTKVDEGTTVTNLDQAQNDVRGIVDQAKSQAYNAQVNDDQASRFREVGTAQYKGPQALSDIEDYQPAQSAVLKTQDLSKLSETDPGRFSLLRDTLGNANYSKGQNRLDNLLLGRTPEALVELEKARTQVSDINVQFQAAQDAAKAQADNRRSQVDAARNAASSYLTSGRDLRTNQIDTRLDGVQGDWSKEYDGLINALSPYRGGDLSLNQAQADKLGVNENAGLYNMLNGVSPETYIKLNEMDRNRVIDKDEQAQLSALDRLAAQIELAATNKYSNPNLAGTQTLADSVDASGFSKEQKARQQGFDSYAASAEGQGRAEVSQNIERQSILGKNVVGQERASSLARQNLQDYLNRGLSAQIQTGRNASDPWSNMIGTAGTSVLFGESGNDQGVFETARARSEAGATAQLLNQLQTMLNNQGYKNRVRIK